MLSALLLDPWLRERSGDSPIKAAAAASFVTKNESQIQSNNLETLVLVAFGFNVAVRSRIADIVIWILISIAHD